MHLRYPATRLFAFTLFACGVLTGIVAMPLYRTALSMAAQERFGRLTYLCDHTMREHLIAKQELARRPNVQNVSDLKAAEVALIECQDYDLLRKRLIAWGLTDNDLALMGLKAIEARGSDLRKVIQIHEIRY